MRTEVQVFTSEKFGQVRTVDINNTPYFVGKDVAEILGYANTNKAIQMHVDDEDKKILDFKGFSHFGTDLWRENDFSNKIIINESGLYSLILSSKLPKAKEFKRWVTSDILPTIRKTGSYIGKSENPNVALVTITPEMAEEMLKKNIGNRKINQANVNHIAADMATGNYKLNWI